MIPVVWEKAGGGFSGVGESREWPQCLLLSSPYDWAPKMVVAVSSVSGGVMVLRKVHNHLALHRDSVCRGDLQTGHVIIITLKGAIRDFYNLLRTVSNTYAQLAREQSCANHVQHIERLSRATCSVPLGTKGQLSY